MEKELLLPIPGSADSEGEGGERLQIPVLGPLQLPGSADSKSEGGEGLPLGSLFVQVQLLGVDLAHVGGHQIRPPSTALNTRDATTIVSFKIVYKIMRTLAFFATVFACYPCLYPCSKKIM